ncbi:MAG: AAA family ATPase [Sandaracinus sp.]|nr:AAA family ATPase [Sandaracinus sp.]
MVLLAAVAGISLTATAVSWWNGRQTAQVREEIAELESLLDEIRAADATARRRMIESYLTRIDRLAAHELETREELATELSGCVARARAIQKKRFGSRESATFQRVFLELDLALSRVNAERAHLAILRATIAVAMKGGSGEVPSPAAIQLPNDFPRLGAFVHFDEEVPSHLHGYRLTVADWTQELDGRAVLFDVNHERHTARVSTVRGALLESNLADGDTPLLAKVVRREREGVQLDYQGVPLILERRNGKEAAWLTPEAEVEVFPEVWTLDDVMKVGDGSPLRVRLHPRVEGSRKRWSPVLLSVEAALLPALVGAYEEISGPSLQEAPWRLHVLDSGGLGFTLGRVTLETRADLDQQAFVLEGVSKDRDLPDHSVRFHAELAAFVPGTEDDQAADRSLFEPFVSAVHAELETQKLQLIQRRSALRLRKLSLVYQDQEEHFRATGSVGLLIGKVERGGRIVVGTITEEQALSWLDDALSAGAGARLRAVGQENAWEVARGAWADRSLGICRLELVAPDEASIHEIDPYEIRRLELVGEGSQQQTMSRALERAIVGRFASARVHETLLGLAGEAVQNTNYGRADVDALLRSDAEVVAVWGPPGTGKTTTLVSWLRSLFPVGREREWPSVLITAPTHVAVNKLLGDLLIEDGRLSEVAVRYGTKERIGTGMEPIWHRQLLQALDTRRRGAAFDAVARWTRTMSTREGREAAAKWLLGPRLLHAATCVGMARRDYGLANRTFDIAIIDEAGKAFGAELMIPAAVAKRVIMVGDHNQLPPTVTTDVLDESIGYRLGMTEVEDLLRRNMFHEIFEQLPIENKGMLTLQHRMHEDIGALVGELFYGGRLQSSRAGGGWSLTTRRTVFIDFTAVGAYQSRRARDSDSQENATERAALRALLDRLSERSQGQLKTVMVVCPYEAQRRAVVEELRDGDHAFSVTVTTVDAVQGGQADAVILLMTRSKGRVQFLLDRHRLNVALSRAREAVLVLGHLGCLAPDDSGPVAKLIEKGRQRGTLDLVCVPDRAHFRRDLAPRVIP